MKKLFVIISSLAILLSIFPSNIPTLKQTRKLKEVSLLFPKDIFSVSKGFFVV